MKKYGGAFVAGMLCGALLFGGITAYAAGVLAEPSSHRFIIDGREVELESYNIDNRNYLQLRDVGKAVGFNVYWDEANRSVRIESKKPYTGVAPAAETEDYNHAVLTGAYTPELFEALRSAILNGESTVPVSLTEDTYQAMLEAEAAIGMWPFYELKHVGDGKYVFVAKYPEAYEEAAAYCQPFVDSLAGESEREKVRQLAFFVCDRLEYSANATSTPRTALVDDGIHQGNCMSYAHNFKFLCDLAHVPCVFVHSEVHQWSAVYVEGKWWFVDVSGADVSDTSWRPLLPILKGENELQGSIFTQSQPWLTDIAKELMIPGSTLS